MYLLGYGGNGMKLASQFLPEPTLQMLEVHLLILYSFEFLAADSEVPGSIPGATRFSE
jgi:hypothetical protein